MLIFIVLLILLFIISLHGIKKEGLLWIWTFILSVILGFRGRDVGDDTARYIDNYYNTDLSLGIGHMEIGWQYCSSFFHNLGFSAYFFHFIVALFTLSCFSFVISKETNGRTRGIAFFLLYTLGFYLYMFNGMRQFVAIGICFIAFYEINKGRSLIALALILFATLFHSSAAVALAMLFVKRLKISIGSASIIFFVSLLIGVFAVRGLVYNLAGGYAHIIDEHGFRTSLSFVFFVCITTCAFFLWIIYKVPGQKDNNWMKLFFTSVVVQNVLCNVVYGPRIVFYFSTAQIISLALAYKDSHSALLKKIIYLYAFVTFFRFLLPELYRTEESLLPYYMTFTIFD